MTARYAGILALALLASAPGAVLADQIETYNFSGVLNNPESTITGFFTVDKTTATITDFSFDTAGFILVPGNSFGLLSQYTPAVEPSEDFVQFVFQANDPFSVNVNLLFQDDLLSFSGGPLFLDEVEVIPGGFTQSSSQCEDFRFCSPLLGAGFSSGTASAVPEISTWAMLLSGFGGLGLVNHLRGRRRSLTA
jgi:hypothetical protein